MDTRPQVTVLGSLNMDITVTVPRLPGAGETVLGGSAVFTPGGKGANQAVAAARLGARVRMAGCAGADDFGRQLIAALRADGVGTQDVRITGHVPTGLAMIVVDAAGENSITVAPGANAHVTAADAEAACRVFAAEPDATEPDAARTSGTGTPTSSTGTGTGTGTADDGAGARGVLVISAEIPLETIAAALRYAAEAGLTAVLNLAPAPPRERAAALIAAGPDWLIVNESEASVILATPVEGLAAAAEAARALAAAGARNAVVTAGARGAALSGADTGTAGSITVPGFAVTAVDSVGAGDTFTGALATALAAGVPARDAARAAAAASAAAVTRPGAQAAMPTPRDVLDITGHVWPVVHAKITVK